VIQVPDRQAALEALRPRLAPGDVVLVKASRGIALDRLVDDLRAELGR
jgi:UDP-N-acetylmuramoyl-tripeptide--D-alanyl-D-alanine ligase